MWAPLWASSQQFVPQTVVGRPDRLQSLLQRAAASKTGRLDGFVFSVLVEVLHLHAGLVLRGRDLG